MPNSALPPHIQGRNHEDWIFPFCYVPRAWTSFKLFQPPKLICGYRVNDITVKEYKDGFIRSGADPCQKTAWAWAVTFPCHITITFGHSGYYMRFGFRWDTIDDYYTFPAFALKNIDGGLHDDEARIIDRGKARI